MCRIKKFLRGGAVQLQTRVGPRKFYPFKTYGKSRGIRGSGVPPLDPRMSKLHSLQLIVFAVPDKTSYQRKYCIVLFVEKR